MKTIREWFEILPADIKDLAINNCLEQNKDYDEEREVKFIDNVLKESFREALNSAFIFSKTKQGFGYWNSIYNKYNK